MAKKHLYDEKWFEGMSKEEKQFLKKKIKEEEEWLKRKKMKDAILDKKMKDPEYQLKMARQEWEFEKKMYLYPHILLLLSGILYLFGVHLWTFTFYLWILILIFLFMGAAPFHSYFRMKDLEKKIKRNRIRKRK